ncbi:hypothetical protein FRC07_009529, partial [Ceratobasidium sp. 392]
SKLQLVELLLGKDKGLLLLDKLEELAKLDELELLLEVDKLDELDKLVELDKLDELEELDELEVLRCVFCFLLFLCSVSPSLLLSLYTRVEY